MPDNILIKKLSWMLKELRKITKNGKINRKNELEEKEIIFSRKKNEDEKRLKYLSVWSKKKTKRTTMDSFYSTENIRLLDTLATHALVTFENILLYEKTKRMTVSDELTSIYNYRYLKTRLEEEMNRANRYKFPLGLMMIDLDNFKEHNDTYGHLSGNKILKSIVGIINKNIRIIDVLCRYGGDEFAVILPNTGIEDTGISSAAERIRKKVEQSQFIFGKGKKKIKMSMSIGVAFYPQEAGSIKELISLADKAMYKAKKGGGNKSVIYQTKNNKRRKKI